MRYTSSVDLENNILLEHDEVVFTFPDGGSLTYKVGISYLSCIGGTNCAVFDRLGLNKVEFCTELYGYQAYDGDWPGSLGDDYGALKRVVMALYKIIEEKYNDKTSYEGSKIKFNFIKKRFMTY